MKLIDSLRSWFMGSSVGYMPIHGTTNSSIYINPDTALRSSPLWRAVNLVSSDIARTPFEWDIGLEEPNGLQTWFEFFRSLMWNTLLHGNGFALCNRDGNGDIAEFVILDPYGVRLLSDGSGVRYEVTGIGEVDIYDMLHVRFASKLGLWGQSPVDINSTAISLSIQGDKMVQDTIANGGGAKPVFTHPSRLSDAARQLIQEEYLQNHSGASNSGKPVILQEGMVVSSIPSNLNDQGITAVRDRSVEDVGRIYGIPSSLLGQTGTSVYGSLEWLSRIYFENCLSAWFVQLEQEILKKTGQRIEFDTDRFTKPPLAETMSALRTAIEAGIFTQNEAREFLDYQPVDDGDTFWIAKNLGQGGGQTNIGTDTSGSVAAGDQMT